MHRCYMGAVLLLAMGSGWAMEQQRPNGCTADSLKTLCTRKIVSLIEKEHQSCIIKELKKLPDDAADSVRDELMNKYPFKLIAYYHAIPVSVQILQVCDDHVRGIASDNEGNVISGSYDNIIRIWNKKNGTCIKMLQGHKNWIGSVAVASDHEGNIISGSGDKTIRLWNKTSGECSKILRGHEDWVTSVACDNKGNVISGSKDKTIRLWNKTSGECSKILRGHEDWVTSVACDSEGDVISGSGDTTIRIWDKTSGACIKILRGHKNWVTAVACDNKGNVISGSGDTTIRIWDKTSGACIKILRGHKNWVTAVACDNKGNVISGSRDESVRVWDKKSRECIKKLRGHNSWVMAVASDHEGNIISGSDDGTVRIWQVKDTVDAYKWLCGEEIAVDSNVAPLTLHHAYLLNKLYNPIGNKKVVLDNDLSIAFNTMPASIKKSLVPFVNDGYVLLQKIKCAQSFVQKKDRFLFDKHA